MFEDLVMATRIEKEWHLTFRSLTNEELRYIEPHRYAQSHAEQLNGFCDAHFPYTVRKTALDGVLRPWLNETLSHGWTFTATNVLFEDELDAAKYKLMWV